MNGRYVTDILKMCMKKFNAEKIIFDKFWGRGYTVNLAANFLFWIVYPSSFQVTRTTIKSLMRSGFGQI